MQTCTSAQFGHNGAVWNASAYSRPMISCICIGESMFLHSPNCKPDVQATQIRPDYPHRTLDLDARASSSMPKPWPKRLPRKPRTSRPVPLRVVASGRASHAADWPVTTGLPCRRLWALDMRNRLRLLMTWSGQWQPWSAIIRRRRVLMFSRRLWQSQRARHVPRSQTQ